MRNLIDDLKKLISSAEAPAILKLAAGTPAKIQCGRSGTFVGMGGKRVTFTPEKLSLLADRFNTEREHLAKIGHKPIETDTPHYGDVTALEYDKTADRLFATVEPTEALIEKNRKEGFRRVSMELSPHEAGDYEFEDLSFLGAKRPAIDGLDPVALAEAESTKERAVFVFTEDDTEPESELFEFAISKETGGGLDKRSSLPPEKLNEKRKENTTMSEETTKAELEGLREKLAASEKAREESEARGTKFAERMKAGAADLITAYMAANHKKLGKKIRSAGLEGFLTAALASELAKSEPETICFAAADKKEVTTSLVEGFMLMLAALPDQISPEEEGELAKKGAEDEPTEGDNVVAFSLNRNVKFAATSEFGGLDDDAKIRAYLAAEKTKNPTSKLTYTQASEIIAAQKGAK